MIKRIVIFFTIASCLIALYCFLSYWLNTQPIKVAHDNSMAIDSVRVLPGINRQIINFIETQGNKIAPTYDTAVCTEFVIQVIDHFTSLTKEERKLIRI